MITCETIYDAFMSENGLKDLPLEMAARAAGLIMSYSYHVHASEFLRFGILDDFLVPRVLSSSIGMGNAEHPMELDGGAGFTPIDKTEKVTNG